MIGQLFGQIDRAVLSARATERDHQVLEAAVLISGDTCVNQRRDLIKKSMNAFLLVEILGNRRIFACEVLKSLFTPGIGQTASIKNESAAIAGFVFRNSVAVK